MVPRCYRIEGFLILGSVLPLIFETCHGQKACGSQTGNRECECQGQEDKLSTTGFGASSGPSLIADCCGNWGLNNSGRVSHPAISGEQNSDGSWLLFFMRGKKIWYTKIKE